MSSSVTTDTAICNLALAALGCGPITSINSPSSKEARVCKQWYDTVRREVLRGYIWNFAKKYQNLTKSGTETPLFNFANAFRLPVDFIRLCTLGELGYEVAAGRYDIAGQFLYTDETTDADSDGVGDTLKISYISDVTSVQNFDPLFVRVLYLSLAKQMSFALAPTANRYKMLTAELQEAEVRAAAVCGQDKPIRIIQRSAILESRRSGRGDVTRWP